MMEQQLLGSLRGISFGYLGWNFSHFSRILSLKGRFIDFCDFQDLQGKYFIPERLDDASVSSKGKQS